MLSLKKDLERNLEREFLMWKDGLDGENRKLSKKWFNKNFEYYVDFCERRDFKPSKEYIKMHEEINLREAE